MLIASMNPCQCGYYGSTEHKCTCTKEQIKKYISKISGPLLDRIDIHIEVNPIKYQELSQKKEIETSSQIKQRVDIARKIQIERYKKYNIKSNAELTPQLIEEFCLITPNGKKMLETALDKLGLSMRGYHKILKIARTIADLEQSKQIEEKHIAEAIQFRSLDRKYWNR